MNRYRIAIVTAVAVALVTLCQLGTTAGATVPHITTTRHAVVTYSSLPSCAYEDGSGGPRPCSWNIRATDGNGRGLAYWISKAGRTHYVWAHSPLTGHPAWHWVTSSEGDALAESGAPHATTRHWQRCIVRNGDGRALVRCPNGFRMVWS